MSEPADLAIAAFEERDRDATVRLYRDCFEAPSQPHLWEPEVAAFEDQLDAARSVVARDRHGEAIGFAHFRMLHENRLLLAGIQVHCIWAALADHDETVRRRFASTLQDGKSEDIRVERFAFAGEPPRPTPRDAYVTAIAVAPEHRRRGMGLALARAQLHVMRAAGARRVFVTCWRAGPSIHVYDALGFEPLLELAPFYADGTAGRLMVRDLVEGDGAGAVGRYATDGVTPLASDAVALVATAASAVAPWAVAALELQPYGLAPLLAATGVALARSDIDRRRRREGARSIEIGDEHLTERRAGHEPRVVALGSIGSVHIGAAAGAYRGLLADDARLALWLEGSDGPHVLGPLDGEAAVGVLHELGIRSDERIVLTEDDARSSVRRAMLMSLTPVVELLAIGVAPLSPLPVLSLVLGACVLVTASMRLEPLAKLAENPGRPWAVLGATLAAGTVYAALVPGLS